MGEFVDRLGSRRFLPVYLLPMALVLFLLAGFDHPAWAYLFMFGAGVSHGMATIVHGALWPEMYGVKHLGAIRALTTSLMVFATALSPVLLGWCFDAQVTVGAVLVGCAVYILVASALCLLLQTSMAHAVAATTGR